MLGVLAKLLGTGVVKQFSDPLVRAYEARPRAENDTEKLAAERDIASIEARAAIAKIEASDRLSARRVGSLLIVVPFGIWYAAVYAVSILNGLFGWQFVVLDVPNRIYEMSTLLVPSILASEVFGKAASILNVRRK